jgi:hypothetical protein
MKTKIMVAGSISGVAGGKGNFSSGPPGLADQFVPISRGVHQPFTRPWDAHRMVLNPNAIGG